MGINSLKSYFYTYVGCTRVSVTLPSYREKSQPGKLKKFTGIYRSAPKKLLEKYELAGWPDTFRSLPSYDEQLQCDVPPKSKNISSFFL